MTKWRNSLKATTNIEENISKEKAWFEKDDNFSTDFKQKIKNLEKEKELSIKKSMDLKVCLCLYISTCKIEAVYMCVYMCTCINMHIYV
jgi:hypothetical protein